jgi:Domain of Unknown Function (DUF1206)
VPLKIATVESRKTHTARKIHANLLQAARLVPASEIGTVQHKAYEWLARAGYAAEGCVYVIMGGLAVLAALGAGGRVTGAKGALVALLSQPFGFVLLGIVAFGLVCLTLWRIAQSILDASMIAWPRAAPAETGVVVAQRQPCVVRTHPARHRVDRGTICGRSCAHSGHPKPLCACVDRTFVNRRAGVSGMFFLGDVICDDYRRAFRNKCVVDRAVSRPSDDSIPSLPTDAGARTAVSIQLHP